VDSSRDLLLISASFFDQVLLWKMKDGEGNALEAS
jgi:hypothetical protein